MRAAWTRLASAILIDLAFFQLSLWSASIQGYVRDSNGAAIAGATVQLKNKANPAGEIQTVHADSKGSYHFTALHPGGYSLSASMPSFSSTTVGPLALKEDEAKNIDLTLRPSTADVEFFDEPKFTVAGVTESPYVGGHGSDAVVRSAETLTRETATLGKEQTIPSTPSSETEKSRDANVHHLKAVADEKAGKSLDAVREYQRAAELDPTESNVFEWGTELLIHRAPEAAVEVFNKGIELFPSSSRMRIGSAVALYARGSYDQAARRFFESSDLNPNDPGPYLFLGKVEAAEIRQSPEYRRRVERFAKLRPENAWANYYYAMSLLDDRNRADASATLAKAQSLLETAVRLDPALATAYLQLGILFSDRHDVLHAIRAYQQAITADPGLEQAHYRLAQAYRQIGEVQKAQEEISTFQRLSQSSAQKRERERSELQQFVVTLKNQSAN